MDNLPAGSKDDPKAPFNEPLNKDFERFVSVTLSYYCTVNLPENSTEDIIKDTIRNNIHKGILPSNYDIDEVVIIKD